MSDATRIGCSGVRSRDGRGLGSSGESLAFDPGLLCVATGDALDVASERAKALVGRQQFKLDAVSSLRPVVRPVLARQRDPHRHLAERADWIGPQLNMQLRFVTTEASADHRRFTAQRVGRQTPPERLDLRPIEPRRSSSGVPIDCRCDGQAADAIAVIAAPRHVHELASTLRRLRR